VGCDLPGFSLFHFPRLQGGEVSTASDGGLLDGTDVCSFGSFRFGPWLGLTWLGPADPRFIPAGFLSPRSFPSFSIHIRQLGVLIPKTTGTPTYRLYTYIYISYSHSP
jgi:hypothetical protein